MKALKITLLLAVFVLTFSAISSKEATKKETAVEYQEIDKNEFKLIATGTTKKKKPGNNM